MSLIFAVYLFTLSPKVTAFVFITDVWSSFASGCAKEEPDNQQSQYHLRFFRQCPLYAILLSLRNCSHRPVDSLLEKNCPVSRFSQPIDTLHFQKQALLMTIPLLESKSPCYQR